MNLLIQLKNSMHCVTSNSFYCGAKFQVKEIPSPTEAQSPVLSYCMLRFKAQVDFNSNMATARDRRAHIRDCESCLNISLVSISNEYQLFDHLGF